MGSTLTVDNIKDSGDNTLVSSTGSGHTIASGVTNNAGVASGTIDSGVTNNAGVASGAITYTSGVAPAWFLTHFRDFSVTNGYFDIPVEANSTYKINLSGVDGSGSNGYAITIFASINGGTSFLSGSNGSGIAFSSSSTGSWTTHPTNSDSARMNHNHQTGFGLTGEVTFITGPAGTGTAGIDYPLHYIGNVAYDSDNQGDFGIARVGGAFAAGAASNTINLFRVCGYLNGSHPNYRLNLNRGKVHVSKLNESVTAT